MALISSVNKKRIRNFIEVIERYMNSRLIWIHQFITATFHDGCHKFNWFPGMSKLVSKVPNNIQIFSRLSPEKTKRVPHLYFSSEIAKQPPTRFENFFYSVVSHAFA